MIFYIKIHASYFQSNIQSIALFSCLLFLGCQVSSDKSKHTVEEKDQESNPKKTADFVSHDHEPLFICKGNLNFDKYEDRILVTAHKHEHEIWDDPPSRHLFVLFGDAQNRFEIAFENSNAILKHNEGGSSALDPFNKIFISNGTFTVMHQGGMGSFSWERSYTFTYSKKDKSFHLLQEKSLKSKIQDTSIINDESLNEQDGLGKVLFEDYNIYNRVL